MNSMDKDKRTLEAIGKIYCRGNHGGCERDSTGLCPDCRQVIDSTLDRTASCPFGHAQNCQDCHIHCQRGEAQQRIQDIMRYAAPRMALRHPVMTFGYLRKKIKGRSATGRP